MSLGRSFPSAPRFGGGAQRQSGITSLMQPFLEDIQDFEDDLNQMSKFVTAGPTAVNKATPSYMPRGETAPSASQVQLRVQMESDFGVVGGAQDFDEEALMVTKPAKDGHWPPKQFFNLDDAQKHGVVAPIERPLMIIAGAGSGKTATLCLRVAYTLTRPGVQARNVLAITFTRKATEEMRERLTGMVGAQKASELNIFTFHQFCLRILQRFPTESGFSLRTVNVVDASQQKKIVGEIIDKRISEGAQFDELEMHNSKEAVRRLTRKMCMYINMIKSCPNDPRRKRSMEYQLVHRQYEDVLRAGQLCDFNDMINKCVNMLKTHPAVLANYSSMYVLVDEFQDTSEIQFDLAKLLTEKSRRLTVVGDDAQSIYGFRGATLENLDLFARYYNNDATYIQLQQNYRSTGHIVAAASHLIKQNYAGQIKCKAMHANKEPGDPIHFLPAQNTRMETSSVINEIITLVASGVKYSDIAILGRTHQVLNEYEIELKLAKLPHTRHGHRNTDRGEVVTLMNYLKFAYNQQDNNTLFASIVNIPARDVSKNAVATLMSTAQQNGVSCMKLARDLQTNDPAITPLRYKLPAKALEGLARFVRCIDLIAAEFESKNLRELIDHIVHTTQYFKHAYLLEQREKKKKQKKAQKATTASRVSEEEEEDLDLMPAENDDDEDASWRAGVNMMKTEAEATILLAMRSDPSHQRIKTAGSVLKLFIERMDEVIAENAEEKRRTEKRDELTLTTIHQAKGLEWQYVFVGRVNEGVMPHPTLAVKVTDQQRDAIDELLAQGSGTQEKTTIDIEEERRLMYVAMTRASTRLYLCFSLEGERGRMAESRFLEEIPVSLVQRPQPILQQAGGASQGSSQVDPDNNSSTIKQQQQQQEQSSIILPDAVAARSLFSDLEKAVQDNIQELKENISLGRFVPLHASAKPVAPPQQPQQQPQPQQQQQPGRQQPGMLSTSHISPAVQLPSSVSFPSTASVNMKTESSVPIIITDAERRRQIWLQKQQEMQRLRQQISSSSSNPLSASTTTTTPHSSVSTSVPQSHVPVSSSSSIITPALGSSSSVPAVAQWTSASAHFSSHLPPPPPPVTATASWSSASTFHQQQQQQRTPVASFKSPSVQSLPQPSPLSSTPQHVFNPPIYHPPPPPHVSTLPLAASGQPTPVRKLFASASNSILGSRKSSVVEDMSDLADVRAGLMTPPPAKRQAGGSSDMMVSPLGIIRPSGVSTPSSSLSATKKSPNSVVAAASAGTPQRKGSRWKKSVG